MYCPQCATQNPDDVKFCRSRGRELEAVALALRGKSAKIKKSKNEPKTPQDCIEKRIEGISGITRGSILLTVSLLIGIAMGLFLPASIGGPWILIWMVFFGWLAVWGGIEVAYGVGNLLESKSRLRLLELAAKYSAEPDQQQLAGSEPSAALSPSAFRSSPPLSVTDGTTRQLDDKIK